MTNWHTLISAQALAVQQNVMIFDCRHSLADPESGEQAYRQGHIPNARFLHLDRDLSGAMTGKNGRHPLPQPEELAAKLSVSGVDNETQVIAYDDVGGMFAARLWWLLRWLGHPQVAVLDGGLQAWLANGGSLSTEIPEPKLESKLAHFSVKLAQNLVNADYVLSHLHTDDMCLVDARSPDRFRGENETLDRIGGHIPGAINRFFKDNLDTDGCFKPAKQLKEEFSTLLAGRDPSLTVHQCGSGVTACHNLLAMEHAGLLGARLYPGSWSEWCSDPTRPMEMAG